MIPDPSLPLRSVLYVPATSDRALQKASGLPCDAVVVDLEDSVSPDAKESARQGAASFFAGQRGRSLRVLRINALSGPWGGDDLAAARTFRPDAILIPKVDSARDILEANDALDRMDAHPDLSLWAMIETPRGLLNIGHIAELGRDRGARLSALVAGTNDLAKETGVSTGDDRRHLVPWLMQIVLAGRAGGLSVLDGVSNDFRDLDRFASECAQSRSMGFDGKTLIHPAQIGPANSAFSPSHEALEEAELIVQAFARPENAGRGVISIDGRMVERLHLEQAERLLSRAERIAAAQGHQR